MCEAVSGELLSRCPRNPCLSYSITRLFYDVQGLLWPVWLGKQAARHDLQTFTQSKSKTTHTG